MSITLFLKSIINKIGLFYVKQLCKREFNKQKFTNLNERSVELAFLFRKISEYWPKNILDIGTGTTALPFVLRNGGHLVTATDNIKDYI